jgi:hypothetical protein
LAGSAIQADPLLLEILPEAVELLVHRFIQLMQLDVPPRFPGEGRDPLLPWAPAFADVADLICAMVRHCLMNRVNDSEH